MSRIETGQYLQDPDKGNGAHAINAAVVNGGRVVFVEPQGPALVKLTQREVNSCFAYIF